MHERAFLLSFLTNDDAWYMPDNMYYENEQKQWKDIRSRYVQDAEWREFFFELKMEETITERGQGDERAWWVGTIRVSCVCEGVYFVVGKEKETVRYGVLV